MSIIPSVIGGLAALLALHAWWSRRHRLAQEAWRREAEQSGQQVLELHRKLDAEHNRERALFDSMVEGVLVLDAANRVLLANRAFINLFHVTGDITGRTIMEAMRSHELQSIIRRVQAEGAVLNVELELPGLKEKAFQLNATPLEMGGDEGRGMLIVFHDLTLIRELENTRKDFVANVSHELRTPLSMIKGYVETLNEGGWQDAEVAPRFLQIIQKHVDRLTYLIEDLLTISQLESGKITMSLQPVDLKTIAGRVMEDLRDHANSRGVKLINEVPPGLVIHADGERMQQVFFNLTENAIKYGHKGGVVRVTAKVEDDRRLMASVQDDGPGIPVEALGRVFERFYRLDRARSREAGGTGLGLSIVKHIIQAHGGDVWVESEVGRGSTFYLEMPVDPSRQANDSN